MTFTGDGNIIHKDVGLNSATSNEHWGFLIPNPLSLVPGLDAFSRRVRVNVPGGSDTDNRECVYDLGGKCISEFTNSSGAWKRSEIYALGQSLATYNNGTTYFNHTDHLGSTRAQSTVSGAVQSTCFYQPFGDATNCTNPTSRDQYTGYEHDTESGLDHAWFRQYASNAGRFTSPDPYAGSIDPGNPQSFNRYAYVQNNPLSFTDVLGLDGDGPCGDNAYIVCFHEDLGDGGGTAGDGISGCDDPGDLLCNAPPKPPGPCSENDCYTPLNPGSNDGDAPPEGTYQPTGPFKLDRSGGGGGGGASRGPKLLPTMYFQRPPLASCTCTSSNSTPAQPFGLCYYACSCGPKAGAPAAYEDIQKYGLSSMKGKPGCAGLGNSCPYLIETYQINIGPVAGSVVNSCKDISPIKH